MSNPSSPAGPGANVAAAVLMLSAMTVMANATISPALPGLREHFSGLDNIETLAGLIVTLPSLVILLFAGPAGWLVDKAQRQNLLCASGLLYAVGGASGLWVDSMTGLLVGRAVLGLGVAGTMVLATTWSADLWHGEARSRFLGWQGAATAAGGIVVILIGGALASLHWRGAFGTYLIAVPVTMFALLALAPFAAQRAAVLSSRNDTAVAAVPFPWRVFAFVGSLGFLFMTAFYVIPTRLPFLLVEAGVTHPLALGAVIALVTAAAVPGALAYGRLRERTSAMTIFAFSWGLMGAGLLTLGLATGLPAMVLGVAVVGLGMGPAMPNHTAYLMAAVPVAVRGRASGLLTTALFSGQFASPLVSAPLVDAFGLSGAFQTFAVIQLVLAGVLVMATLRMRHDGTEGPGSAQARRIIDPQT
jgi:MFS family permease